MLCCLADELEGFEQDWNDISDNHFHGWNDTFDFPRFSGEMQLIILLLCIGCSVLFDIVVVHIRVRFPSSIERSPAAVEQWKTQKGCNHKHRVMPKLPLPLGNIIL